MRKVLFVLLLSLICVKGYSQEELKTEFKAAVKDLQSAKYEKAEKSFTEILKKATDKQVKKFCYIYRGFSYNGMEEYAKAIADFDKAIELDPDDLATYTDRAKSKGYNNDLEGAKKDFLYVLSKDSSGAQAEVALYYLGLIEYRMGNYKESVSYYDKLDVLVPNDYELYFNRAVSKERLLDITGAINDYGNAIKIKDDYREAYANRGVCKINLLTTKGNIKPTKEETADACNDLQKAKQLGDNSVDDMIYVYCDKK